MIRPSNSSVAGQYINFLWDRIDRLEGSHVPNAQVDKTVRGSFVRPDDVFSSAGKGAIDFEKQWVPKAYKKDAIVIRETVDEQDDGNKAGTYIALQAINAGDAPPGEDDPTPAAATAILDGSGHITGVDLGETAGSGYTVAPTVTITGDGTGATAIAELKTDGSISITITNEGTGYTQATIQIDPPGEQKWYDFALYPKKKLTLRVGKQRVILDAGRDGGLSAVVIENDYTNIKKGCILLQIQDLIDIQNKTVVDDTDGNLNLVIKAREWDVCLDFGAGPVRQKAIFVSSAPYNPT